MFKHRPEIIDCINWNQHHISNSDPWFKINSIECPSSLYVQRKQFDPISLKYFPSNWHIYTWDNTHDYQQLFSSLSEFIFLRDHRVWYTYFFSILYSSVQQPYFPSNWHILTRANTHHQKLFSSHSEFIFYATIESDTHIFFYPVFSTEPISCNPSSIHMRFSTW